MSLDETIARIAINSSGQKDAANSRIFLTDALNSVIAQLSDDNAAPGSLQNSYGYSPYGEGITVGPDVTKNPVQYTSRENDGTGLLFYRARYYDPVMKRFISSDPIGLQGGLNMYGYVGGNPLGAIDPRGLATFTLTGGGSAVVIGGGEGSFGVYISNKPNDIGIVISGGAGGGANVGLSAQLGYVPGPLSNVSGNTQNTNLSCVVGSGTWMTDPKTGNFAGATVGPAGRLGASVTNAQTETWGLRGLLDRLFDKIGGIK